MEIENTSNEEMAPVMSTREWFIVELIMLVPLVNLIMLFVWGFGETINPNKSNWAKASLLKLVLALILNGIIFIMFFGTFMAMGGFD